MSLIDRGKVMTAYLKNLGQKDSYKAKFKSLVKAVDEAPAVDAVPVVHAKWSNPFIGGYDGFHAVYYMTCSKCMKEVRDSIFRYCPMCGAKMDREVSS